VLSRAGGSARTKRLVAVILLKVYTFTMEYEMNITEYAKHRHNRGLPGSTRTAIYKALKTGRISRNKNGKIFPEKADREWDTKTRLRVL